MSRHRKQFWAFFGGAVMLLSAFSARTSAQDPLENAPLAPGTKTNAAPADKGKSDSNSKSDAKSDTKDDAKTKPEFIAKTPYEWRKLLTRTQYAVTREKATEPAFTGKYSRGHYRGTFICVCCDAAHVTSELFSSRAKFDSGTGWPSFYQPYNNKSLQSAPDYSDAEPRVEVTCRRCGAHLGHVFEDGPPPTGLRFCINSAAIKLASSEAETSTKKAAGKTSSKSKAKAKGKSSAKAAPKRSRASDADKDGDSAPASAADKTGSGSTAGTSGR